MVIHVPIAMSSRWERSGSQTPLANDLNDERKVVYLRTYMLILPQPMNIAGRYAKRWYAGHGGSTIRG